MSSYVFTTRNPLPALAYDSVDNANAASLSF